MTMVVFISQIIYSKKLQTGKDRHSSNKEIDKMNEIHLSLSIGQNICTGVKMQNSSVCLRWLTEEKIIRDSVKNKVSKLNKIKIR
jgi:hypothetical protein